MGLLAAVEAWVKGRDHQAEWREWERMLEVIIKAISDIPSVQSQVTQPGRINVTPTLSIQWDQKVIPISPAQLVKELWEGEPRVGVSLRGEGIYIIPYMLEEDEEKLVAQRLRAALRWAYERGAAPTMEREPAKLAGNWLLSLKFILGQSQHSMSLKQEGASLSGQYRSGYAESTVEGLVSGNEVNFRTVINHEASHIPYSFAGKVEGEAISGQVSLGEYWTASFSAVRVG